MKEKEEKKKKKTEEDNKKRLLEEELKRRSQQSSGKSTTTSNTTNNTSKTTNTETKPIVKAEPTVREITPEEFERNQKLEKEERERKENEKNQKIEINYGDNNKMDIDKKDEIVIEKNKVELVDIKNRVFKTHDPNVPYETPDKNKSCISPNHPCIFSKYGESQVKEIWTDEHGKTSIMPDKNHGGKMEKYFWGQPRVEENWICIPIDKSVKGKEVKVNATSNTLQVIIRGEELINREFPKTINV